MPDSSNTHTSTQFKVSFEEESFGEVASKTFGVITRKTFYGILGSGGVRDYMGYITNAFDKLNLCRAKLSRVFSEAKVAHSLRCRKDRVGGGDEATERDKRGL